LTTTHPCSFLLSMQTSLPVSFLSTGGQQRIFVMTLFISDKSFCSKIFSLLLVHSTSSTLALPFSNWKGGKTSWLAHPPKKCTGDATALELRSRLNYSEIPRITPVGEFLPPSFRAYIEVCGSAAATKCVSLRGDGQEKRFYYKNF